MRVLLRGYYGYGNFGDDLLMYITAKCVQEKLPEVKLDILSFSNHSNYIKVLVPSARIVKNTTARYDIIIHGGGGVFFDYSSGNSIRLIMNSIARVIGYSRMGLIIKNIRRIRGIGQGQTNTRVGLSLGIGTYPNNSRKLLGDLVVLTDFSYLSLRDKKSVNNFKLLCHKPKPTLSTDLAFASRYWYENNPDLKKEVEFGICLRTGENDVFNEEIIQLFSSSQYSVRYFVMDKTGDKLLIDLLHKHGCDVIVWDPSEFSILYFAQKIAACVNFISSRAHGAIVAAICGIKPSIIEIEPKLATVNQMLNNQSKLIKPEEIVKLCKDDINSVFNLNDICSIDITTNETMINKHLDKLFEWLASETIS